MLDQYESLAGLIDQAIGSTSTRERNALADALRRSGPVWHTFDRHASAGGTMINPGDRVLVVAYGRKVKTFRPVPGLRDQYPDSAAVPVPEPIVRETPPGHRRVPATLSYRSGKTRAIGRPREPWPEQARDPDPRIKPPWED